MYDLKAEKYNYNTMKQIHFGMLLARLWKKARWFYPVLSFQTEMFDFIIYYSTFAALIEGTVSTFVFTIS